MTHSNSKTFFASDNSFNFNQYDYFGIKTKNKIDLVEQLSPYYEKNDLCLALSIRYLIEERQHHIGGGKNYMFWLKGLVESENNERSAIKDIEDIDDVQKKIFNEYRLEHLSNEIKKLLALNSTQSINISAQVLQASARSPAPSEESIYTKNLKTYIQDLFIQAHQEYGKNVEDSELKFNTYTTNMVTHLSSRIKISYLDFLHQLNQPNENKYFLICIGQQAMAVTFIKTPHQNYWTFFDPNIGAYSFNDYHKWYDFMQHTLFNLRKRDGERRYAFSDLNDITKASITYTPFMAKNNNQAYDADWKKTFDYEEHYLITYLFNLKTQNKKWRFNHKIEGQIIGYKQDSTERKINEIEIKIFYDKKEKILKLPFNSFNEIRQLMNKRIDTTGKLILNETKHPPLSDMELFKDLQPADTLSGRVKQAINIINKISDGLFTYTFIHQDKGMARLLRGFFQNERGVLDEVALIPVIFNPEENKKWICKARNVLMMSNIQDKLTRLTDQQAIEKLDQENTRKNQHKINLISLLSQDRYKTFSFNPISQTIYLSDDTQRARDDANTLCLLWMKHQTRDEGTTDDFSNAINAYTFMCQQKREMTINDEDEKKLKAFHEKFTQLTQQLDINDARFFQNMPVITTRLPQRGGLYFMLSDKHILGLSIQDEHITLYDPHVGEIIENKKNNHHKLIQFLEDYLNFKINDHQTRGEMYGFEKREGNYHFIIKEANIERLTWPTKTELEQLSTFMRDTISEEKLIEQLPDITIENLSFSPALINKMGGMIKDRALSSKDFNLYFNSSSNLLLTLHFNANKLKSYLSETDPYDPDFQSAIEILRKKSQLPSQGHFFAYDEINETIESTHLKVLMESASFHSTPLHLKKYSLLKALSHPHHFKRMNHINNSIQSYSYWLKFREFIKITEALQSNALTEEDSTRLHSELEITTASLSANVFTDLSHMGLHKREKHLSKKLKLTPYSPIKKMKFEIRHKLTRFGGPFLEIFNTGFDIYDFFDSINQLSNTTDADQKQDLTVQASFSGVGVALSISVVTIYVVAATTATATAANVAMLATPISFGAGITLLVTRQLYTSFRQIEELQKHIQLTSTEKWENGVRIAFGWDVTTPVQERYEEAATQRRARAFYDDELNKQAKSLFEQSYYSHIKEYHYSPGKFTLTKRFFKKMTVQERHFPASRTGFTKSYPVDKTVEDHIYPFELEEKLTNYSRDSHVPRNEIKVVDSEAFYFEPSALQGINDTVDAALPPALHQRVADNIQLKSSKRPLIALFNLGDGNDTAKGKLERENIFKGGDGIKNYTGGNEADIFYLFSSTIPDSPSFFNGGDGEDLIVAEHSLEESPYQGYAINLKKATVHYIGIHDRSNEDTWRLVAHLKDIEHINGNIKTKDDLVGNEKNNILNGLGASDEIWGYEGNDTLILEEGMANGGTGIDHFIILKNTQNRSVTVEINDDGEESVSFITFRYRYNQIQAFTLRPNPNNHEQYDIEVVLQSDNDIQTTVIIKKAYQFESAEKNKLSLNRFYVFNTSDGLSLFSQFPEYIEKNLQGTFPFTPHFEAQYNTLLDSTHQEYFKKTLPDNISLTLNKSNGRDSITVGKDTIRFKTNVQLILSDTPFDDVLSGDDQDNILSSSRGNDELTGGKGQDLYQIQIKDSDQAERIVSIYNYDDQNLPDDDLLMLPVKIEDIKIKSLGNDVELSLLSGPKKNLRIKLMDFMLHPSYRHMILVDAEQQLFQISLNENRQPYFFHHQSQLKATEKSDTLVIYGGDDLPNNTLNAKEGNDVIFDNSHHSSTLKGGKGDDIIITRKGNKKLFGDEGNDQLFSGNGNDELSGGKGNDSLLGGMGDDTYLISGNDGRTNIEDDGGKDKIVLTDMAIEDLGRIETGEDIYLFSTQKDLHNPFSIKIKKGALSHENKIEEVFVNDQSLLIESISLWDANTHQALMQEHNKAFLFSQGFPFNGLDVV